MYSLTKLPLSSWLSSDAKPNAALSDGAPFAPAAKANSWAGTLDA
jgi:hypothetical protein